MNPCIHQGSRAYRAVSSPAPSTFSARNAEGAKVGKNLTQRRRGAENCQMWISDFPGILANRCKFHINHPTDTSGVRPSFFLPKSLRLCAFALISAPKISAFFADTMFRVWIDRRPDFARSGRQENPASRCKPEKRCGQPQFHDGAPRIGWHAQARRQLCPSGDFAQPWPARYRPRRGSRKAP